MKPYLAEALKAALEDVGIEDVDEVVEFEEETVTGGYCSTCYHEYIELVVRYLDKTRTMRTYRYYGTLAELMSY